MGLAMVSSPDPADQAISGVALSLSRCQVASDDGRPDDCSRLSLKGREHQGHIYSGPALAHEQGVPGLRRLTAVDLLKDALLFAAALRRDDKSQWLADGFEDGEPQEPFRRDVPARNPALRGHAKDGVLGAVHDAGQHLAV